MPGMTLEVEKDDGLGLDKVKAVIPLSSNNLVEVVTQTSRRILMKNDKEVRVFTSYPQD